MRASYIIASAIGTVLFLSSNAAMAAKGDACNAVFKDKAGNLRQDKVAAYVMHEMYDLYRKADTNCDGKLSLEEIQKFENSEDVAKQIDGAQHYVKRVIAAKETIPLDQNGEPPAPIVGNIDPSPLDPSCAPGWKFFLRGTAEDIKTFECPKTFKSASGAQFGYSRDGQSGNSSWTAKGVAALAYVWRAPEGSANPYLSGFSLWPWVSFNRLTNSLNSLKSKEVNLLSYGGTAEFAVGELLGGTQYLRGKTQLNSDFSGNEKSWSATAEWQPVSTKYYISAPIPVGPYLFMELDPILRYINTSRRNGSLDPIFDSHDNVSRVGPVLAATITPAQSDIILPDWIQSASLTGTFEWLTDTDTRQIYRYYTAALNLPIDPTGHLGLQFNYQYGQVEETGQKVNQITAGLGAKW